nr:MAG TPA: hypothetical protein [Caudoviricetes sp.]
MQFVNKKDIEFKRGYFVVGTEIMMPATKVISEVNKLSELNDVMSFIKDNLDEIKAATEKKDMPVFTPKAKVSIKQTPNTPTLDEYVNKLSDIMDEIETATTFAKADKIVENFFADLLEFAHEDDVLLTNDFNPTHRMNMNPLNMSDEEIVDFINAVIDAKDYIAAVAPYLADVLSELWH